MTLLPPIDLPEGRVGRPVKGGPGALRRVLGHLRARGFSGYLKLRPHGGPSPLGIVVIDRGRVRASLHVGGGGLERGQGALRSIAREAAIPTALLEVHAWEDVRGLLDALRPLLGEGLAQAFPAPPAPPAPPGPPAAPPGEPRGPPGAPPAPPPPPPPAPAPVVANTFDTFVVGPQNRFAHAAARAIAEGTEEAESPLLILSGPGLGKTHLLTAIAHHVLAHRPGTRLLSLTAEAFGNEVLLAARENRLLELHERFRSADLLLLDDLQFLPPDPRVQEELFHTFDALGARGAPIVLASDRNPREIPRLEERLVTRFLSGLVVEIEPPDLATKVAILEARARRRRASLPREVLELLASRTANNVRELGAALNRVLAYARLLGRSVDLALAREALGAPPSPVPAEAPGPPTAGAPLPPLVPGVSYLVEEAKPQLVLRLFGQRAAGGRALAITRMNPARLRAAGPLGAAQILWLSDRGSAKEPSIPPSLERMMNGFEEFLAAPGEGTLLLDGLDYLASYNGFESVLSFLRKLVDAIAESPHVLLVSLDPRTLEERQARVLEREMEVIRSPSSGS